MSKEFDRREFITHGAKLGAAIVLSSAAVKHAMAQLTTAPVPVNAAPLETIRVGYVGVGGQGMSHVRNLLNVEGCRVTAVCDIVPEKVEGAQKAVTDAGQPKPAGYSNGPQDFMRLCESQDVDLVYTATPWEFHVPVCVAAMKNGKHAASEVPLAVTIDECWQLVETSEKTGRHCIMMENCCYGQPEMAVLNMVRKGLLGEIVNGEAGYLHDLRELKFSGRGEGLWRTDHSIRRDGNLYPTHGLGPLAEFMNINRGDQFDYLVSMSSKSRGLNFYAAEHFGADDPRAKQKYALGDVNSSLIRTKNGVTIILIHDCDTPRPYSRVNLVQGTKGICQGYPDRVYVEGVSEPHTWDTLDKWLDEYNHPLWKTVGEQARGAGHGGMDYLEDYRLIEALRSGRYPDYDVYDGVAWSAVSELSEKSVASRSAPQDFPDFTRGAWKTNKPIFVVDM